MKRRQMGRVVSIFRVGMPQPRAVWVGYLVPELLLPWIVVIAQVVTNEKLGWNWA
jgi:hypothetical protein